jgi:hypothetical protein
MHIIYAFKYSYYRLEYFKVGATYMVARQLQYTIHTSYMGVTDILYPHCVA